MLINDGKYHMSFKNQKFLYLCEVINGEIFMDLGGDLKEKLSQEEINDISTFKKINKLPSLWGPL